jgi:hypothetical protein
VGATIEFGAAEAPRARPRVMAIRDMAGMLAKNEGRKRVNVNTQNSFPSLLINQLPWPVYILSRIRASSQKWNVAARPRQVSRNGAMIPVFCFRQIRLVRQADEYDQSLFHLLEKLSSSLAANEMSCRALVVKKAPPLPRMLCGCCGVRSGDVISTSPTPPDPERPPSCGPNTNESGCCIPRGGFVG